MKLFSLCILIAVTNAFGQEKMIKKLEKELGTEFVLIRSGKLKPIDASQVADVYSPNSKELKIGEAYHGEFVGNGSKNNGHQRFITTDFVSNSQYAQFIKWVQDSIARDRIYFNLEEDEEATELIIPFEYYFPNGDMEYIDFEPSDRALNRELCPLNWDYKLKYDDPGIKPILADMYIPRAEYFRNKRIIDQRKLIHHSELFGTGENYRRFPISPDNFDFALNALHPFDRWSVYAYLNDKIGQNKPVTNIQPFMAELYCEWMTEQMAITLNKPGYEVQFRLPTAEESESVKAKPNNVIEFAEYNVTDQWRITNNEFRSFADHVLDSIRREVIYFRIASHEEADKFIITEWDDRNLNILYYTESFGYDPADRQMNREFAQLNYKTKFKKTEEYEAIIKEVDEKCAESVPYRYSWMDTPSRALKGRIVLKQDVINPNYTVSRYIVDSLDANGEYVGEDLDLTGNMDGRTARDHKNTGRFIRHEKLLIPNALELPENDELAEISYEQALACYNWKYRIDLYKEGDWQQFVFPSEEEFYRIMKGESIVLPARMTEYEAPVFRVVVELIEK